MYDAGLWVVLPGLIVGMGAWAWAAKRSMFGSRRIRPSAFTLALWGFLGSGVALFGEMMVLAGGGDFIWGPGYVAWTLLSGLDLAWTVRVERDPLHPGRYRWVKPR